MPEPEELRHKLLLAHSGYPSVLYFDALAEHNASFIIRLTRGYKPWVLAVYGKGQPRVLRKPVRLRQFLSQHPHCALDLNVKFRRGRRPIPLPTRRPAGQRQVKDVVVHEPRPAALHPRAHWQTVPLSLAGGAELQGMEVIGQRAYRRGPDLGMPVRCISQTLPGPCCAVGRTGRSHLDSSGRNVRQTGHRSIALRSCIHSPLRRLGPRRNTALFARKRSACTSRTQSDERTPSDRPLCRGNARVITYDVRLDS